MTKLELPCTGSSAVQELLQPFSQTQELRPSEFAAGRDFIVDLMLDLSPDVIHANPVELVVRIKAAQELLETWRRGLCKRANDEFVRVTQALPGVHSWRVADLAVLSTYTPSATWKYPEDVVKLIEAADTAKAKAKADHTAVAKTPPVNTATTFLFKTAILDTAVNAAVKATPAPAAPAAQV